MTFDKEPVKKYESWFYTPEGVYVDEKEKELLLQVMRLKQGETILEVGCGTGRYIEYFNDLGLIPTGIEPMEELRKIALNKTKIKKEQIIAGSYERLPFEDDSFDNVISIIAIQFSINIKETIKEMIRVAKNKVAIGFLNKYSLINFFKSKERQKLFKKAIPLSSNDIKKILNEILEDKIKNFDIMTKYTLYVPPKIGFILPIIDDIMEKTNLPIGDYGVMLIKKKNKKVF